MEYRISTLHSYVLDTDAGFAPNPYHGTCSLACCGPQIREDFAAIKNEFKKCPDNGNNFCDFITKKNMWVIGISGKELMQDRENESKSGIAVDKKNRYPIYIMKVTDVLTFEEYDKYPDYQYKIPKCKRLEEGKDINLCPRDHSVSLFNTNICSDFTKFCLGDNIYNSKENCFRASMHLPNQMEVDREPPVDNKIRRDRNAVLLSSKNNFIYFGLYFHCCPDDKGLKMLRETLTSDGRRIIDDFNDGKGRKAEGPKGHDVNTKKVLEKLINGQWHRFLGDNSPGLWWETNNKLTLPPQKTCIIYDE